VNAKRLGLAALAATILAVTGWWLEIEKPQREATRLEATSRLLLDVEALTELRVERGDETYTMRPAGDGSWALRSSTLDDELVSDKRAVDLAIRALFSANVETLMEEAPEAEALEEFGLQAMRLRVAWTTREGERSIRLGGPVPPHALRSYGLIDGRLVTLPRELIGTCAWGLDHWRLKTQLLFSPDDLSRLEIERPRDAPPGVSPRLVLSVDEHPQGAPGWWRVVEPVDAPALPARTRALMSLLYRLQADSFVADHPDDAALERAGLLPPRAVLTLHLRDGEKRVLRLGDQRELTDYEKEKAEGRQLLAPVHARLDDGPLVLVRPDLLESSLLVDDAYRDNRALPLPKLRLVAFTFEKPRRDGEPHTLELYRELEGDWRAARPADAAVPQNEIALLIGSLQAVHFGRFEDEIAADPSGFETAYDLTAPDTFQIEARALDASGASFNILIEAGPPGAILRERTPFRPVRITDRAGRRTVGVAKFRAFDKFLAYAANLRRLAEEAGAP